MNKNHIPLLIYVIESGILLLLAWNYYIKTLESNIYKSRTFPSDGVADAKVWFQTVKESGFDGYYSLELFDDTLYAMSAHDAAQLCMDKLQAFANSL